MGKIWIGAAAILLMLIVGGSGGAGQKTEAYILNISIIGSGRVVGKNIECSAVCNITLPAGKEIVLTAFPASEWSFLSWGSSCNEKGACTVLMDGDKAVEAIFTYP